MLGFKTDLSVLLVSEFWAILLPVMLSGTVFIQGLKWAGMSKLACSAGWQLILVAAWELTRDN